MERAKIISRAPSAWLARNTQTLLYSDRSLVGLMIVVSLLTGVGVICSITS
jgi:hypothetical protein